MAPYVAALSQQAEFRGCACGINLGSLESHAAAAAAAAETPPTTTKRISPLTPLSSRRVDFVRIDIDACPALGLKNNVLNAPTYAFYRRGLLLESFSGAIPQRLLELLAKHKGQRPSGAPWKLLSLGAVALVTLVAAASWGTPRSEAPSLAALEDHGGDGRPPTPSIPPVAEEDVVDEGGHQDMLDTDDDDLDADTELTQASRRAAVPPLA